MILGISGKIQELGNLFHSYVLGMMHPLFFCPFVLCQKYFKSA